MSKKEFHPRSLPKIELHLHLEGSVTPELLIELAARHGTSLASWQIARLQRELFSYPDFSSFLGTYKVVCQHLQGPDDYRRLFSRLARYLADQNIVYAEVFYTPAIPFKFGYDGQAILQALLEEARRLETADGIVVRWILDNVRQFGAADAERTAELAVQFRSQGVVGVGLGGDELSRPMSEYRQVYEWAGSQGIHRHVHAGEIGGAGQVWEALEALGAERIGHGVRAADDPELLKVLAGGRVGLDVCLSSNQCTGVCPDLSLHPLPLFLEMGVPVTLNTDDPGLFGTDLEREYALAAGLFGLQPQDLRSLVRQGVGLTFLSELEKRQLEERFHPPVTES